MPIECAVAGDLTGWLFGYFDFLAGVGFLVFVVAGRNSFIEPAIQASRDPLIDPASHRYV